MAKRVNTDIHPSQLQFDKVDSNILLELFPFAIFLDHDMCISRAGEKIIETWILQNPNKQPQSFWGSRVTDIFKLRRPKGIVFDWETVVQMNLVLFELELMRSESDPEGEKSVALSFAEKGKHFEEHGSHSSDLSCAVEAAQTGK